MDVLRGPYYSFNHRILCLTGHWPFLSEPQKIIRASIALLLCLSLFIPSSVGLFTAKWKGDYISAIENFSALVVMTMSMLFVLNLSIHNQQFAIILKKIQKDWEIWSRESEIEILKREAIKGRKFRMIYGVIMLAGTGFIMISLVPTIMDWVNPLNESRTRVQVVYTNYGVNVENYFNLVFLHHSISIYLMLIILSNADMMFMASTHHASSIYKAIGYKLSRLVENKNTESIGKENFKKNFKVLKKSSFKKNIENDIIFCIKQHKDLLIFVRIIHECFSFVYFIVVLINLLAITMTGVSTVLNWGDPTVTFKFLSENMGLMVHILYLTVPCEEMTYQSYKICNSVYKSEWYVLPVRSRKLLLMIMKKSTEPCEIVCGKLYTFSMKNFALVMKTAISYFTVLTSLQ